MHLRLKAFITRESVLLAAFVVMAGACWAFIGLQEEVFEGETRKVDEQVLLFFREAGHPATLRGPAWTANAARDVTALGGVTVLSLLTLGLAGFFVLRRQWGALALMLITVIGGVFIVDGLKTAYGRERPTVIDHLVEETSYSFPSGHSTMATVVYLTLAVMLAEFQEKRSLRVYILGYAVLLAGLIGVSRVVLGVHYPSDVAAGWTLGLLWATCTWVVARVLKRRAPRLDEDATAR